MVNVPSINKNGTKCTHVSAYHILSYKFYNHAIGNTKFQSNRQCTLYIMALA